MDQWAESYSQVGGGIGSGILLSNDMTTIGDDTYFFKISDFKYSNDKQVINVWRYGSTDLDLLCCGTVYMKASGGTACVN